MGDKRNLAILGSTGSIGRQTLDIVAEYPDLFHAWLLVANTSADLLIEQARKFRPHQVIIAKEGLYAKVRDALADQPVEVMAGSSAIAQAVTAPEIDTVVTAMVGYSGLEPTISAIGAGKKIALANKETLVVAGELINEMLQKSDSVLYPVDSEHGAFYQCLVGERHEDIDKLLLTASGGPFRNTPVNELDHVKASDALKHPNWSMGNKITIDSASMMNKGFEVIEAKWLFGVPAEKIQVLIHPQSIVHSAVQFHDGSVKAQLGVPDMRLPIQYAFTYPDRLSLNGERLDLFKQPLEFFEPDLNRFKCLALAFEALRRGGNACCVVNAANEVVNLAFRQGQIGFLDMGDIIEKTLDRATVIKTPAYEDYINSDQEAREIAGELAVTGC